MRVQHNIASMNSYRNYNNNTKAINKNLEKLSSGYKINRAGDDAAGLAISEKMRAQITGLEGAQKNAKDGISLVQTAEGALTEVHSMLNRMYSLAEQSANGTYSNDVDRKQLQKEVDALRTEINRIADSSNFNGTKLLDGSISGKSQIQNIIMGETKAVQGVYTTGDFDPSEAFTSLTADDIGKTLDYTVTWQDASGNEKTTTVSLTFHGKDGEVVSATATDNMFIDVNGAEYKLDSSGKLSKTQIQDGILAGLNRNEELSSVFTIEKSTDALKFTAKEAGSAGAQIRGIGVNSTLKTLVGTDAAWGAGGTRKADKPVITTAAPRDALQKFNASTGIKATTNTDTAAELKAKIFEINGYKFVTNAAASSGGTTLTASQVASLGDDVNILVLDVKNYGASGSKDATAKMAADISRITGLKIQGYDAADPSAGIAIGDLVFEDKIKLGGSSLTLQIGDTADSFNQMDVAISDIHAQALGIESVSIEDADSAAKAMTKIQSAINSVSDVRGGLGAIQNRLEHTINNLSVMQENIQDAESTIRDTDVADEMMKYTKNSILVQSAQAMLAQANQQPQGVLQLLQ